MTGHGTLGCYDLSGRLTTLQRSRYRIDTLAKLKRPPEHRAVPRPETNHVALGLALSARDEYIENLEALLEEAEQDIRELAGRPDVDLSTIVRQFLHARSNKYPGVQADLAGYLIDMDRLSRGEP